MGLPKAITIPFSQSLDAQIALAKSGGYVTFKKDKPIFQFDTKAALNTYQQLINRKKND